MGCSNWLLVTLVLLFSLPAQGHEACYNDSWTYHSHTYSCFRLFRLPKKWTEARDYCSEIPLGSTYGVITRLAKIDDETTDNFIRKDLFPKPGWLVWIGLYYNTEKSAFRWDGYPDETPKYTAANWEYRTLQYVSTFKDGWRGKDGSKTNHCVCQHPAKTIGTVTCTYNVEKNGLKFTCTSQPSPVEAGCQWNVKYAGESSFRAWSTINNPSYEFHTENPGGVTSYITACSVTLSNSEIKKGTLNFKIKMYPDISGLDLSTREEILTVGRQNMNIDVPDTPLFKILDKTLQASSPIHFHENDRINITCEVQSGNPPVHSVTLSCEFPFEDSNVDNNHTVLGTDYVINKIASRDMNGKKCTCIGHHLTGPIESSPLAFNVTYPTEVNDFKVNENQSRVEVNVNETLKLSCLADGNPPPSITIRKLNTSYVDISTWMSDESGSKVEIELKAKCGHNGRYRCSAYAAENNQEETKDLDIRVRCPPTYCNEISGDLKLAVRLGEPGIVPLCVVAYPMPSFTLLKKSITGWHELDDLGDEITQVTSFESQQNVSINLSVLGPSHLGEYALSYSVESGVTSVLYFQLTASLTPCKGEDNVIHEVRLGQPASLTMCVIAFPIPSNLLMEKALNESKWRDYNNSDVTITTGVDFDTLTHVTVNFPKVQAADLGIYRLFDPQDVNGSYLILSLSESRSGGGGAGAGAVVGAVVSIVIIIIIVVVIVFFILRRRRNRENQKESPDTNNANDDIATYYNNDVYNNEAEVSVKRKRAKTGAEVPTYDNNGYVLEHRCSNDYDDEKETVDTERPYSNMTVQNKTPDIKESESNTAKAEDDLVYIQLDFKYTTDKKAKTQENSKPKSKSKKAKEVKEEDKEKEEEEQTEYAAISATATIKIRKEKENDENKENDGVEEEAVYENMKAVDNVH